MRNAKSRRRGSSLVWAILVTLLVAEAVALVAGTLIRRAGSVRRMESRERMDDLAEAGFAFARSRLAGSHDWRGPESLTLAGGRVICRRETEGAGDSIVVEVEPGRGRTSGRFVRRIGATATESAATAVPQP